MADAIITVIDKCERTLTLIAGRSARRSPHDARREHAVKELLEGKRAIAQGDYARARKALRDANAVMRSRKLTLVVHGFSLAPGMLARLYNMRAARQK